MACQLHKIYVLIFYSFANNSCAKARAQVRNVDIQPLPLV